MDGVGIGNGEESETSQPIAMQAFRGQNPLGSKEFPLISQLVRNRPSLVVLGNDRVPQHASRQEHLMSGLKHSLEVRRIPLAQRKLLGQPFDQWLYRGLVLLVIAPTRALVILAASSFCSFVMPLLLHNCPKM